MADFTLFGLRTCDSCRKARRWLDTHGVDYDYHDVRDDGLDALLLAGWTKNTGWEPLVNRRSTTWRNLPKSLRESMEERSAIATLNEHPTLLKRPVLVGSGVLEIGFSDGRYADLFGN